VPSAEALTGGYQLAFGVGAAFALAAALIGAAGVRTGRPARADDAAATRAAGSMVQSDRS